MATTETPREITRAWLARETPKRRSKSLYAAGFDGSRVLLSYGEHFVAALDDGTGVWVNSEDWYPSYNQRYPFGQGVSNRAPDFSPTTRRHIRGITEALSAAGFTRTGDTAIGANGHRYEFWDRGEGREVSPL